MCGYSRYSGAAHGRILWEAHVPYYESKRQFREANKHIMGMLDTEVRKFNDTFKDGEIFTLEDAKHGPEIDTDFGRSRPVQFKINGKWYSIFGRALSNQVDRMESDDRQAMEQGRMKVKIVRGTTKKGTEVKLLVSSDTPCSADGKLLAETNDIPF